MVVKIMVPIRVILGLYWGYTGDNKKENENYYIGLYGWLSCPFLGTLNIRFRVIIRIQTGTIILTTTHLGLRDGVVRFTEGFRGYVGFRVYIGV